VIRPARTDDLPALQHIERRAGERFRDAGMPEIADDEPYDAEELAAAAALLVATDPADAPLGYAMVTIVDDHAHLEQLSVLPEHGGQGIGTMLLDAVVAWARARGDDEVTLTTFREVPFNAPLYARRGFAIVEPAAWTDGLSALVASEAAHGLEVSRRVVMRRVVQ
jgi:GNAT superfamily N-acetyltransferase